MRRRPLLQVEQYCKSALQLKSHNSDPYILVRLIVSETEKETNSENNQHDILLASFLRQHVAACLRLFR